MQKQKYYRWFLIGHEPANEGVLKGSCFTARQQITCTQENHEMEKIFMKSAHEHSSSIARLCITFEIYRDELKKNEI